MKVTIKPTLRGGGTIDPPVPGNELWKQHFDHGYLGEFTLNRSGEPSQEGDEVQTFIDQIGTLPANYSGLSVPLLSQAHPKFFPDFGGMVRIPNETGLSYGSTKIAGAAYPFESMEIHFVANYDIQEAYNNDDGFPYWADKGSGSFRTKNSEDYPGDPTWDFNCPPVNNQVFIIFRSFTDDVTDSRFVDRVNELTWMNNVSTGKQQTNYKIASGNLRAGGGAYTNSPHSGIIGLFLRQGAALSDDIRSAVIAELMTKYNCGHDVNKPYATNIQLNRSGSNYSITFGFKSIGWPEDVSRRIVRTIYVYGGITRANYIPLLDGRTSFNSQETALLTAVHQEQTESGDMITVTGYDIDHKELRVEVTCFDTQGNHLSISQTVFFANK